MSCSVRNSVRHTDITSALFYVVYTRYVFSCAYTYRIGSRSCRVQLYILAASKREYRWTVLYVAFRPCDFGSFSMSGMSEEDLRR